MTMRVIQRFEVVQIQKHQGTIKRATLARRHALAQSVIEQTPVGQTGQRVIKRQLLHLVCHQLVIGDVLNGALDVDRLAIRIAHDPAQTVNPTCCLIFVPNDAQDLVKCPPLTNEVNSKVFDPCLAVIGVQQGCPALGVWG